MDVWFHHENPYPFVPQEVLDRADSVRASLPNKYYDPHIAADLFEEALDEFLLCDDQGAECRCHRASCRDQFLFGANPLILGVLASDREGPYPQPGDVGFAAADPVG